MMSVMESIKDKAGSLFDSMSDINKLAIDKIEQAAQLNIDLAGYVGELGIKQVQSLSAIRDAESLQKFTADSISLGGELTKRLLDEGKTWWSLGLDFTKKVTDLVKGDLVKG